MNILCMVFGHSLQSINSERGLAGGDGRAVLLQCRCKGCIGPYLWLLGFRLDRFAFGGDVLLGEAVRAEEKREKEINAAKGGSMETGWGGTPQQRMERRYAAFAAQYGVSYTTVSTIRRGLAWKHVE